MAWAIEIKEGMEVMTVVFMKGTVLGGAIGSKAMDREVATQCLGSSPWETRETPPKKVLLQMLFLFCPMNT